MSKSLSYKGENPTQKYYIGVDGIEINLISYPAKRVIDKIIYSLNEAPFAFPNINEAEDAIDIEAYANGILETGGMLGNWMESISFIFSMNNVTRSFTHELVRHRIGHCYVQQGGRNNDFRHNAIRIPSSFATKGYLARAKYRSELIKTWYAEWVDAGIPIQDARFFLNIGICTHIFWICNLRSLMSFMRQRLCNNFHWEMNYIAKLAKMEVYDKLPELGKHLYPTCEAIGRCVYKDDLFQPCSKYYVSGGRESIYKTNDWRDPPNYVQYSGKTFPERRISA